MICFHWVNNTFLILEYLDKQENHKEENENHPKSYHPKLIATNYVVCFLPAFFLIRARQS